ncbi:MAG: aspartate kinase [Candidatus Cloacimonetes bacterium]|nr:aspartate kinase [Candidatus Cloacimonadota bacterium]
MAIIVKKFGGTSVGNIDLIRNIAHKIAQEYGSGDGLVLVVSAMAKTTDELFSLAYGISQCPSRREMDMLLTAGERISMSLLSLALMEEGVPSISFTGSQSGIITDDKHGNARILKVNAFRIHEELAKGKVVIVAGFQGVSLNKEITTLGRGGSDTSAVALACYLGAEKCEIYTDVDGVYSADPRIVDHPAMIKSISPSLMLTLCYSGSKVLHPRAVEFALKYGVKVEVKSSFTFAPGSIIENPPDMKINYPKEQNPKEDNMEERTVSAIAHKEALICYKLLVTDAMLEALSTWNLEVFKSYVIDKNIELFIEAKYEKEADYILKNRNIEIVDKIANLAFVNLVGLGLGHDPAILASVMQICKPFEIVRCLNNEQSVELLIPQPYLKEAVQTLHKHFIG